MNSKEFWDLMPCRAGRPVWVVEYSHIYKFVCRGYELAPETDMYIRLQRVDQDKVRLFSMEDIGKTVFFDPAEAMAAQGK